MHLTCPALPCPAFCSNHCWLNLVARPIRPPRAFDKTMNCNWLRNRTAHVCFFLSVVRVCLHASASSCVCLSVVCLCLSVYASSCVRLCLPGCVCFFLFVFVSVSVSVFGNGPPVHVQFDAMPYGTMPYDVSEGEMRWQIYTSLALGAKGVLYFCYWTPWGAPAKYFVRGQAIMTPRAVEPGKAPFIGQQVPSQKYPIVQKLNAKLKVLGNFLLKKDSSAVLQLHGAAQETRQIEHPVLTAINGTHLAGDLAVRNALCFVFLTFQIMENDNDLPRQARDKHIRHK